jgi:hypothetical protein
VANIYTLLSGNSKRTAAARHGEVLPIKVEVIEILDADKDLREYQVLVTLGYALLRERTFACAGYLDLKSDADVQARALGRQWLAE